MGIQINGQTDIISATDGNLGVGFGITFGETQMQIGSNTLIHSTGINLGSGSLITHNINSTGVITATSFTGNVNATGISNFSGVVVSGMTTATGGINVGDSFIRSNQIGIGTTTTTGRNAGVGTAIGTLIYNATESSIQTYDGSYWATIGPGSGSGVIKSLGTNITIATQVTLYNVSRRVDGKVYYFNNITFDITSVSNNTTAWTQPANGSYKWSYVYINPSTNQFFVSDTGPSLGNNTATISSQLVVYLFPIYVDDNAFYKFDMIGNHVIITGENIYAGYTWYISGLGMYAATSTQATGTSNYSSYIPTTAAFVKIRMNGQWKYRNDSGATVYSVRYFYPRLSDGSGYSDSMVINDTRHWKTPTAGGSYYPITYQVMEHWFSTFEHDFTSVQWGWYFEGYYGDGQTNHGFGMREFIDRAVF